MIKYFGRKSLISIYRNRPSMNNLSLSHYIKGFCEINLMQIPSIKEPEDYRTVYLENLPTDWSDDDIRVRLEQLGNLEKLHIIKNSIGQKTGRVLAVYNKIDSLVEAIDNFKDKMPFMKPVKIRFYREFKTKKKEIPQIASKKKSDVLMIKNLPSDLRKEDLYLFLSEFKEPVHISYLRDHENEFRRVALVYFYTKEDAEDVLKYANLRYVSDKQLFISFSYNHWDICDFRTRAELGLKLPPQVEMRLFKKQIDDYKRMLTDKGEYSEADKEKLEYLKIRTRKLEYRLGEDSKMIQTEDIPVKELPRNKNLKYQISSDKSLVFADKKLF